MLVWFNVQVTSMSFSIHTDLKNIRSFAHNTLLCTVQYTQYKSVQICKFFIFLQNGNYNLLVCFRSFKSWVLKSKIHYSNFSPVSECFLQKQTNWVECAISSLLPLGKWKACKFPGHPLISCFFVATISIIGLFSPLANQQPTPPILFTHLETPNLGWNTTLKSSTNEKLFWSPPDFLLVHWENSHLRQVPAAEFWRFF